MKQLDTKELNDVVFYVKSNRDYEPGFILTDTFLSFSLGKPYMLNSTIVLNTMGTDITVTDNHGMISTVRPIKLDLDLSSRLDVPIDYRGVIMIERRNFEENDISISNRYSNEMCRDIRVGVRSAITDQYIYKSNHPIKEMYRINRISARTLEDRCRVYINVNNYVVSKVGYEELHPNVQEEKDFIRMRDTASNESLSKTISYYNDDLTTAIYINVMSRVIKIKAQPISDPIKGVGVNLAYTSDDRILGAWIPEKDFSTSNVFLTLREAEANLNKEQLINNRKIDMELTQIETKIFTSLNDRVILETKSRMDLISRSIQIATDKEKYRIQKDKEDGDLETIKKIVDIVSMIKKLIF